MRLERIALIRTDFPEKFGIPRQSGLAENAVGRIVFDPPFRDERAVRGLEGFEYLWLFWRFEVPKNDSVRLTVRPPRLDGQEEVGVFATRSPFRPNPIGLSSVRLERIEHDPENGPTLVISGADLMDGTPIYDIKPYIPYTDAHPEAAGGFAAEPDKTLEVVFPEKLLRKLPEKQHAAVFEVLAQDPRPSYRPDGDREYGLFFAGSNIRFQVRDGILTVISVEKIPEGQK